MKCGGFFVLLFAASFIVLFGGSSASAASTYDNVVQITDKVELYSANSAPYNYRDFSLDWLSKAIEAAEKRCNFSPQPQSYCTTRNNLYDFRDNINDYDWAVFVSSTSQSVTNNGYTILMSLKSNGAHWTFENGDRMILNGTSTAIQCFNLITPNQWGGTPEGLDMNCQPNSSQIYTNFAYGAALSPTVVKNGVPPTKIFLSTFPITYPAGYEGEEIPDTYTPPAADRTPAVTVSVSDRDITINFDSAGGADDYVYRWAIGKYVPSNGFDPQTIEDIEEGYNEAGTSHSTYLPHRGNFGLSLIMCDKETDRNEDCTPMENTRATWLDIVADGSYFTASTGDNMTSEDLKDCITDDIGGINVTRCKVSMLQDCELEGSDLLEKVGNIPSMMGCHMMNFFNGMRSLALFLLLPSSHKLNVVITSFMEGLKAQLGFIYDSFDLLISNIGKMVTAAASTNCVLSFGSLSGEDVELSMCSIKDAIGSTAYDLAINLFRGAVAVGFMLSAFRYLQSFFSGRSEATI